MNIILTEEEIKNIMVLIGNAQIKGNDAVTVALLMQKFNTVAAKEITEEDK